MDENLRPQGRVNGPSRRLRRAVARLASTDRLRRFAGCGFALLAVFAVADVLAVRAWDGPAPGPPVAAGDLDIDVGALTASGRSPAVQPVPTNLRVESIGIDTALVELRVDADGVLGVPSDYGTAGWWAGGPRPGAPGAAVVVGHVDSRSGPAVFYRLRELAVGDVIAITRGDGSVVTFAVDAVRQYPKADLPTGVVYGGATEPSLRLITCGGRFDEHSGHYEDNVVVFATVAPVPS